MYSMDNLLYCTSGVDIICSILKMYRTVNSWYFVCVQEGGGSFWKKNWVLLFCWFLKGFSWGQKLNWGIKVPCHMHIIKCKILVLCFTSCNPYFDMEKYHFILELTWKFGSSKKWEPCLQFDPIYLLFVPCRWQ